MDTLEKAKLILRKHILENKEDVIKDLNEMREKSSGNFDLMEYIESVSRNLSIDTYLLKNK